MNLVKFLKPKDTATSTAKEVDDTATASIDKKVDDKAA